MRVRFLFGLVMLIGCDPSGTQLTPGPGNTDTDLTQCNLSEIEESGGPDFIKFGNPALTYQYNSDRKVIERDDDERGQAGNLTKTTYTYDGDTVRSAHRVIAIHEGTQIVATMDLTWHYSKHLLDHIDFVTNDTISGVKKYFRNDAGIVFKVVTTTDGVDSEEDYVYSAGKLIGYQNSDGADYTYTFDDKVNPESLLDVNMEDPLRYYPYNMTTRSDGYMFEYTYDVSGYPLQRDVYLNSSKVHTDQYTYVCPN